MGGRRVAAPFALIAVCFAGIPCDGAVVSFEAIPIGTIFGQVAGNLRGETVLIQEGIAMSVDELILEASTAFNRATIGGEHANEFDSTPLELNNISAIFDFTALDLAVDRVTLEIRDFGGTANLSVNGGSLIDVLTLNSTPLAIGSGVTSFLDNNMLTLDGPIDLLQIGGQELSIDNIRAVPEPATCVYGIVLGAWMVRRRRSK